MSVTWICCLCDELILILGFTTHQPRYIFRVPRDKDQTVLVMPCASQQSWLVRCAPRQANAAAYYAQHYSREHSLCGRIPDETDQWMGAKLADMQARCQLASFSAPPGALDEAPKIHWEPDILWGQGVDIKAHAQLASFKVHAEGHFHDPCAIGSIILMPHVHIIYRLRQVSPSKNSLSLPCGFRRDKRLLPQAPGTLGKACLVPGKGWHRMRNI